MGVLSASEHDSYFYFIPIFKELVSHPGFRIKIMLADFGTQPDFSEKNNFLTFSSLTLFFGLHVFEFTVVHQPANRRDGGRSNFNQIEPGLFSHFTRLVEGHDAQLLTFVTDKAHFPAPYHLVYA
jgi:hypothetical protein